MLKEIQYFETLLFAHYLVNRYVELMVLKDKLIRNFYHIVSLRSAHTRELVLATSRGNKSHRVNSPFLLESLVVRPKILSLRLAPRNKTGLNFLKFLRLVPQNASCELFVGQVPVTKLE